MRTKRQNAILRIITERPIETQKDLSNALIDLGFSVTQATVSRDIKELRLIKILNENGRYVYSQRHSTADLDLSGRFNLIFEKCVVGIDYALNDIVIKTLSGMAQAAAASLDSMNYTEIVGSIAGDDTIILIMRSEESAKNLSSTLKALLKH